MSDQQCDIHDVTKAASDLMSFGCTTSATYLDSVMQLKFSSIIATYANEVIRDVNDGVISAWDGMQELRHEYDELASKAWFYAKNGIGAAAGVVQVELGAAIVPTAIGAVPGSLLIAHGVNNIWEGVGGIYNGPDGPSVTGPTRAAYEMVFRDDELGSMAYYTTDLFLSGYGLLRKVTKTDSVRLFVRDPINYEKAYRQTGRLAMIFEGFADTLTINSMHSVYAKKVEEKKKSSQ